MNWFQKLLKRRTINRKRKPGRSQRVKPFRRFQKDGWAELDYQEAINYWTKSQGAR